ncbi:MAG: hypothetical protein ACK5NQ_10765 [Pseudomonas sp.]
MIIAPRFLLGVNPTGLPADQRLCHGGRHREYLPRLWYPIIVAVMSFVIGQFLMPETKDRDLRDWH